MAKHTKGPWFRDDCAESAHMAECLLENPSWLAIEDTSPDGGHIAYCHPDNADLIAEAPAMVELLRDMLRYTTAMHVGAHKPADAIRLHHTTRAILSRIDGAGEALPDTPAPDLAEAAQGDTCTGCGRESFACSLQPCPDVIADREA